MSSLQTSNFETITIPSFLKTKESQNFFLNAYIEFANELSSYDKSAKPKMTLEEDKVLLEGDYEFSECGIQVSSYKRITIYFEEYNGIKYLCRRTFKNEVRHFPCVRLNLFAISDTLEVFNRDLKVAECVYSASPSEEAQHISKACFIPIFGDISVKDILDIYKIKNFHL